MLQNRVRWEPISNLAQGYFVGSLVFENKTLSLVLFSDDSDKKEILITFNDSVQAYSSIYEGFILKDDDYCRTWPDGTILKEWWAFYKVEHSLYMKTLMRPLPSWIHYAVYTDDLIIGVIANKDPIVEHMPNKIFKNKKVSRLSSPIKWGVIKEEKANNYSLETVSDIIDEFSLILKGINRNKNKIQIIFKHGVDGYKVTKKEWDKVTISGLRSQMGNDFDEEVIFFKTKHSSYLTWLSDQSYGVTDSRDFTHFSFVTSDYVVDVIASYEPEISLIQTN